jgi:hemerythrin-like metal-binding protein
MSMGWVPTRALQRNYMKEKFRHYVVGIPALDAEHWELLEMMESLIHSFEAKDGQAVTIAQALYERLIAHGKVEEEVFTKIEYTYAPYHIQEHHNLEKKMAGLVEYIMLDPLCNRKYLVRTLEEILFHHIDHADRQVGDFIILKEKGK